jgi:hypothetical protein
VVLRIVRVATQKRVEPGTGFKPVPGSTVFGALCPTQDETKSPPHGRYDWFDIAAMSGASAAEVW